MLSLLLLLPLSGCTEKKTDTPSAPPPSALPYSAHLELQLGQPVILQFRRDALGVATQNGISPDTDIYNGARMSIKGVLKAVEAHGVIVKTHPKAQTCWVPWEAVLLIRTDDKSSASAPQ